MRHVTSAGLDALDDLLRELRTVVGLTEKKRGVFYHRSRAFLHFHEDDSGLYADVRGEAGFDRFRVSTKVERRRLLSVVRRSIGV